MKLSAICAALVLAFFVIGAANVQAAQVRVTIDGAPVHFPAQEPVIIDGSTLVPVRGVFEALGFAVDWFEATRTVMLARAGDTVLLGIDSPTFTANGISRNLGVPAQLINDTTMIPLRAVIESVGYSIGWNDAAREVYITTHGTHASPPGAPALPTLPDGSGSMQIVPPIATIPGPVPLGFPFGFETTDINGNTVTHADLGAYEAFFVYVWATWCFACVQGLPGLAALADEFAGRVGFVGLLSDFANSDRAADLMRDAGADFMNINIADPQLATLRELSQDRYVPRSIILGADGTVVGDLTVGSSVTRDRERILQALQR